MTRRIARGARPIPAAVVAALLLLVGIALVDWIVEDPVVGTAAAVGVAAACAAVVIVALIVADPASRLAVSVQGVVPLALVVVILGLWLGIDEPPADGFYSVSAQIIPVLLLALLVEVRIVDRRQALRRSDLAALGVVLVGLVVAELTALASFWVDDPDPGLVFGGVAAGVLGLLFAGITPDRGTGREGRTVRRPGREDDEIGPDLGW